MKKSIVAVAVLAGALMAGPTAHAGDVDIGISIGIPGITWGGPTYYYAPPPPPRHRHHHNRPRVIVVPGTAYVAGPGYRPGWTDRGHYDRHPHKYQKENWKHNRKHRGHGRND